MPKHRQKQRPSDYSEEYLKTHFRMGAPEGYLTSEQAWDKEIADQQYVEAAPLRAMQAAEAEFRQEAALTEAPLSEYWDQELKEMWPHKALADSFVLGGYDLRREGESTDGKQSLGEFKDQIIERGITVTRNEAERLFRFMNTNVRAGIAVTVENWWRAFARLYHLSSAFRAGVTGYSEPVSQNPQPVAQPQAPKKKTDPMDLWSTERRDELQMIYGIVNTEWQANFANWFEAWRDSLRNNFNGYELPEHLFMKVAEFLQQNNLSPFQYESWDKCRRHFVANGWIPEHMLTDQEKLNALIDQSNLNDPAVRRMINLRQQEILDKQR